LREENDRLNDIHRNLRQNWEKTTIEEKSKDLLKKIENNLDD